MIDYDNLLWRVTQCDPQVVAPCGRNRFIFNVNVTVQSCSFDLKKHQKLEALHDLQQMLNNKLIPLWGTRRPVIKRGGVVLWPNSGIEVTCANIIRDDDGDGHDEASRFFCWFVDFLASLYCAQDISDDIDKACLKHMLEAAESVNKNNADKGVLENGNQNSNGSQETVC